MYGMADASMLGTSAYERRERDFYPTPLEATAPILHWLDMAGMGAALQIWECAAGDLAMTTPLLQGGHRIVSSDIVPLAGGIHTFDFLTGDFPEFAQGCNGIVTNPPYGELAQKFCEKAHDHILAGHISFAAMLMRHEYDCAVGRKHLFGDCREFAGKITMTFRPRWIAGSEGSPRHNYAWYIWAANHAGRAQHYYAHREDQSDLIRGLMSMGS